MTIYVYDNHARCVFSGEVGDDLEAQLNDKLDAIKVDGKEYSRACMLLNRPELPEFYNKRFTFVGDDARTVYLNWN